jgi:lysophospholipase L1-like esterase
VLALLVIEVAFSVVRWVAWAPVRGQASRAVADGDLWALAVGDSYVFGLGAKVGFSWPDQLQARTGRSVVNLGVPGTNSSEALALATATLESGAQPEWLLVSTGNNNPWNLRSASFWTDFPAASVPVPALRRLSDRTGLGRLLQVGSTAWPREVVEGKRAADEVYASDALLLGPPERPFLRRWLLHDLAGFCSLAAEHGVGLGLVGYHWTASGAERDLAKGAAACPGARFVDVEDFGVWSHPPMEFVSDDGWHPNARGYAIIADRVAEALVGAR